MSTTNIVKNEKSNKRVLSGRVVSDKQNKTLVVKVVRKFKDTKYKKFVSSTKKYHVHDDKEMATLGDWVTFVECKPISKLKRWALVSKN